MEKKLTYIKSLFEPEIKLESLEMNKIGSGLKRLNDRFKEQNFNNAQQFRAKPRFRNGQVWLVDTSYFDYYGQLITTPYPFIVVIVDASGQLEGESFCRVQPISPFVELAANDDFIYKETDLVGFPFLVETWNEQPILPEILSYSVGYLDYEGRNQELNQQVSLTKEQQAFRIFEVDNSTYLRHSVLSYLRFLEERQTTDTGVVININERAVFPKLYVNDIIVEESYAIAAKTKIDNQNKYFELTDTIGKDSIKIRIKRNDNDFIISVFAPMELYLRSREGKSIIPIKANDRIIFTDLNAGVYFLSNLNNQVITIRLK